MTFLQAAMSAVLRQAFASSSRVSSKQPSASFPRCLVCQQQQQWNSDQTGQRLFSTSSMARDVAQSAAGSSSAGILGMADMQGAEAATSGTSSASSSLDPLAASAESQDTLGSSIPVNSPFESSHEGTEPPRYIIERAGPNGASLPIYLDYRNNRTRVFTVLRKIGGDVHALKEDLSDTLPSLRSQLTSSRPSSHREAIPYKPRSGRTKPDYSPIKVINQPASLPGVPQPQHASHSLPPYAEAITGAKIVLQGNRKKELERWLLERGF